MQANSGSLYTSIQSKVAEITFGHPAGNSFPSALLERLVQELNLVSKNPDVNVVLIKSEGDKTFCAGASFDELLAIDSHESGKAFFSGFANVINAMRTCSKLVVGQVQGKAVGGGVGLIAACDYALATEAAAIKLSELSIGIGPFVIAPAIERKMGKAALAELALAPETWQNAYWAKEKGLYARVFETVDELQKETLFFTEKLASYNPEALSNMKKVFWEGTEHWETLLLKRAAISGDLVQSTFTKSALSNFKK